MNPPPMNRLTTDVGRITKAEKILKPKSIITTAPISIKPSMIPSMTPKDPSVVTQGRKLLQAAKKAGTRSAAALRIIRMAATPTRAAGTHDNLARKGRREYGPYHPGGRIAGCWVATAGVGIGATCAEAGSEWKQTGHRVNPEYGLLHDPHNLRPQRLHTPSAGRSEW
jgi:hypothetical protein